MKKVQKLLAMTVMLLVLIAAAVRGQDEAQWNVIRDHLDTTFKQELQKGNEVDLR